MFHLIETIFKKSGPFKIIITFIGILPITLALGIIGQIGILSKLNAVPLFSWTQAANDTIMLLPPMLAMLAGYYIFEIGKKYKSIKGWHTFGRVALLIIVGFVFLVIMSIVGGINYYAMLIFAMLILGMLFFWVMHLVTSGEGEGISDKWFYILFPAFGTLCVLGAFYFFTGIPQVVYNSLYEKMYITLSGATSKVEYMNDKYIFLSSDVIIPNNGEYKISLKQ